MYNIPFPLKLSWRLMRTASHERTISIMVKLCFWGILISAFSLALVAAVMRGFEIVTHKNIKGIQADLLMRSARPLQYEKIKAIITTEFQEGIEAITPTSTYHAIVDVPDTKLDISSVSFITVIDPQTAQQVNNLQAIITTPKNKNLLELLTADSVLVGKDLAKNLQLKVGDTISLLFPAQEQTKKERIALESATAKIAGIFATGIEEFDLNGIFASQAFIAEQFLEHTGEEPRITQINIKLKPGADSTAVQHKLKERFKLNVVTWQELYPAIIAALTLEKYGMILILSLIVLVASMNTLSLLFMFISHKRRTISLLYAYGMSQRAIMFTCMLVGMLISWSAAALGLLAAYGASIVLDTYQLIALPDAYYVSYLPAHMDAQIIIIVIGLILIMSLFTTWYPAQAIDRKRIAHILKFEA